MGACDQKTTESILDFFYESGGNFIDTANNYQNEQSEQWIGEWMQKRGVRDQVRSRYSPLRMGDLSWRKVYANLLPTRWLSVPG